LRDVVKPPGEANEQQVAGGMTERVVVVLEAVEIKQGEKQGTVRERRRSSRSSVSISARRLGMPVSSVIAWSLRVARSRREERNVSTSRASITASVAAANVTATTWTRTKWS
jgi:hypothetical protein